MATCVALWVGGASDLFMHAGEHWAFKAPKPQALPPVQQVGWCQSPIDRFVLARIEAAGLSPSPMADARTLIRRAYLDLLGLPPSPEAVDAFLADSRPDRFSRLVEHLLAQPQYGERWGRHWLDVARYADTKGYVYYYEESRFVHPFAYRDWVVGAFNADLPYDRFLLLQLAADKVEPRTTPVIGKPGASTLEWPQSARPASHAALGFLALGRRFLDLAPDIVDDQIDVVMRGTQGLTASCARCHDHKFDPFPTQDYYSLYGIFQSSVEKVVSLEPEPAPDQLVPYEKARRRAEFQRGLKEKVERLETAFKKASDQVADRLRTRVKDYLVAAVDPFRLPSDANVRPAPDDINPFNVRQWDRYIASRPKDIDPVFGPWKRYSQLPPDQFERLAAERSDSLLAEPLLPSLRETFKTPPRSMTEVANRYGDLLLHAWRPEAGRTNASTASIPLTSEEARQLRNVLAAPDAPVLVPRGQITDLDVHLYFDDPNRVALVQMQTDIERYILTDRSAPAHAVVVDDRPEVEDARIFKRGDPSKPGEQVPRTAPQLVRGNAAGARETPTGSGRLQLALSIVAPENPLTARVLVNRVWAHHFGSGLVRTPSDFGLRADPPSHPELLDWLAIRFAQDGLSIKSLHRLILNSATYQQSAAASQAGNDHDPDNRLLWRFPSHRLSFEALRDSLLHVSGGLDERLGGPAESGGAQGNGYRRSIYTEVDRKAIPGVLRSFDFTNPDVHTPQRHITSTAQQALFLMNNPFMEQRARELLRRPEIRAAGSSAAMIRQLFRDLYQRLPTEREMANCTEFIALSGDHPSSDPRPTDTLTPMEQLAQVLLLSNELCLLP